jgi:hypothetical protein
VKRVRKRKLSIADRTLFYVGEFSPEEEAAYERDEKHALMLLSGYDLGRNYELTSANDLPKRRFLSHKTSPTQDEAREALCRILLNRRVPPSKSILNALVGVFDPGSPRQQYDGRPLKAILKKRSKGHSYIYRDIAIAVAVDQLRNGGETLERAASQVGETLGKSEDHIKRIYGNVVRFTGSKRDRRRPGKSGKSVHVGVTE